MGHKMSANWNLNRAFRIVAGLFAFEKLPKVNMMHMVFSPKILQLKRAKQHQIQQSKKKRKKKDEEATIFVIIWLELGRY